MVEGGSLAMETVVGDDCLRPNFCCLAIAKDSVIVPTSAARGRHADRYDLHDHTRGTLFLSGFRSGPVGFGTMPGQNLSKIIIFITSRTPEKEIRRVPPIFGLLLW